MSTDNNRAVVVTGAGSGIGRAAALAFAGQGDRVVVADLNAEAAAAVVAEIEGAGGTAVAVVGDLSEQKVVDEVVATALARFGAVDVLVNNAGIMDSMSAVADVTDAEWERLLRINLTAPFLLSRAVVPHMLEAGRGAIVFTASEAALRGSAAGAAYTAAKHGIVGLTKSIAVMYRGQGIRANAIAPGGTVTNIQLTVDPEAAGPRALGAYMGNVGTPAGAETQAAAIVFLASDAASNISGAVLPVDGGWSAV
ncbi:MULTISPECIES: SDR family NAD(P)-dependent oxidoreductase [unclassified Streptomyces]|uniref:SDR family NAD(P)-dependent oxidoreductase n=1 Tax=unclassified Streptomyces TaxID=2593676 RepID=UPI000DB9FFB4|nr:SDR family NAD(P)-dependent oxidoreductase [Streptomyces sp. PsTaAH-137]MYT69964.1 SDR family NAD(P)-dependent oxidoreductase [Streptomyces sp. SID8367]RAJ88539.1 NAD(P)-dependent dehydrogenase (short-subunit alcohol dehydrogenase family) [Streptomyces sp. PsTaAH-137]